VHNQMAPFGMYGLGPVTGWPQYPMATQFLPGYQQDPYGLLARQAWPPLQATNPWVVQALLGELVGAIARQGHHPMGLGHVGLGGLPFGVGISPFAVQAPLPLAGFGPLPFGGIGPTPQLWNTPLGQGSYGIGAGIANGVAGTGLGAGLPFPVAAGAWSVPTMAMV
jgi:hypothetical protein